MNDSNNNIQKVIDSSDIVQIISEYIPLEKKGNDFKGLCPFHSDSNPSLSVSPSKKVFKCFSCNIAGNVIQFVQKIENISFIDALKKVASKSGVTLNIRENPQEARFSKYYQIMSKITQTYEFYLKNTIEGKVALEYLTKRNIDEKIIKHFQIGLASQEEMIIVKNFIENNEYLPLDLKDIGVIGEKDSRYFDLFRGRIIFPLKDLKGNIVGFSGRIYNTLSESKYINSQDNIIFKKSSILYNYSEAVSEIKQKQDVIVFEGFMDVIAAYKAGVTNTLATMGTALTEEQIKIILKLTNNVTICYDGDIPGIEATKRAIKLFIKFGVSVSTVVLEDGLDPDDYLNKYGKEQTKDLLLNKRVSCVDYLYNIEKRKLTKNDLNSITSFQKNIYTLIKDFNSNALRSYLFNQMSKDLDVSIDDIKKDFDNLKNVINIKDESRYQSEKKSNEDVFIPYDDIPLQYYNDIPDETNLPIDFLDDQEINSIGTNKSLRIKKKETKKRYENAERGIIYLSFYDKAYFNTVKKSIGIEEFTDKINRKILINLFDYYDLRDTMNQEEFVKKLDEEMELERFNSIINTTIEYDIKCLNDYINMVKLCKYEIRMDQIKEEMTSASGEKKVILSQEYAQLKKIITKFKKGK